MQAHYNLDHAVSPDRVRLQIPATASAHDVAATLLAFFASLPSPFMPPAAAQVCDVCVPSSSAASSLLADSLSPAEWAVFRHISGQPPPPDAPPSLCLSPPPHPPFLMPTPLCLALVTDVYECHGSGCCLNML